MIRILAPGLYASVQDAGRTGFRRIGIPWAGALVPAFRDVANALVGNLPDVPAIECFEAGFELEATVPVRLALAGLDGASLEAIDADGGTRPLAPWRSHRVRAGTRVRVRSSGTGRTVTLALEGLDPSSVLGSASTYARAGLGGVDGRALAAGDDLACRPPHGGGTDRAGVADPKHGPGPDPRPDLRLPDASCARLESVLLGTPVDGFFASVHAVPGPQADAFAPGAVEDLCGPAGWTVSPATDRMGARLDGPILEHRDDGARDIVSDAIVPGSVQVPGDGLPIVLLRDAHTAGGYPKIATLASGDLAAVALARPGTRLRIVRTDVAGAVARTRAVQAAVDAALDALERVLPTIDTARLLRENLVDGVTDGRREDPA